MPCSCATQARCPVCDTLVRVPLTGIEGSSSVATLAAAARKGSTTSPDRIRRLAEGSCPCPACGNLVAHRHSRYCLALALAQAGIPERDRDQLLSRMTFSEG